MNSSIDASPEPFRKIIHDQDTIMYTVAVDLSTKNLYFNPAFVTMILLLLLLCLAVNSSERLLAGKV